MNKRALHIKKHITTILLLVFFFLMQKTIAQKKSPDQSIQLIVGSYRYELNALILKRKLIKEGFKEVKVLKKTNGLYRVSINQLASKEEVDKFRKMTIQADKTVDLLTVKKIMYTITEGGVYEINFAVMEKKKEKKTF